MEVLLPRGFRKELAEEFNVSRITVWKALTGRLTSKKARQIYQRALEYGGVVYHDSDSKKVNKSLSL